MYGVGGTSLTGTYSAGPPASTQFFFVTNNFNGTYDVTFDHTVSATAFGLIDANFIIYDNSLGIWTQVSYQSQPSSTTVRVLHQTNVTTCTKVAIVGALSYLSATPAILNPQELDF